MISFKQYLIEEKFITSQDLKNLEFYADRLFNKLGIDVAFTKHFLDRANDPRNKKQITVGELIQLFNDTYTKHGVKIARLGPDVEAVLKDMKTNINAPIVLDWDRRTQMLRMSAKTVMRKKNFKTPDKEFRV